MLLEGENLSTDVDISNVLKDNITDLEKSIKNTTNFCLLTLQSNFNDFNNTEIKIYKSLRNIEATLDQFNKKKSDVRIDTTSISMKSLRNTGDKELNNDSDKSIEIVQSSNKELRNTEADNGTKNYVFESQNSDEKTVSGSSKSDETLKDFAIDTGANLAGAFANSAFGSAGGTIVNSMISNAVKGAEMTGPFAEFGVVIGLATGAVDGLIKNFEKSDEAFKEYNKNLYETVNQAQNKSLGNGINVAAAKTDSNGKYINENYNNLNKQLALNNDDLDAKKGQGFINTRTKGMENEVQFMDSPAGKALGEANTAIGEYEALLANKKEEIKQNTLNDVLSGSEKLQGKYSNPEAEARVRELSVEYQASISVMKDQNASNDDKLKAGATIERVVSETNAMSENENNASTGVKIKNESNLELANDIKNDTALNKDYWDAGYQLGDQLSQGLASAFLNNNNFIKTWANTLADNQFGQAYGLSYVPYNDFPARLHEGERVLTASEAKNYNSNSPNVTITGNSFAVREETDIDKIAMQIVSQFTQACDLAV